jgi:L-fuconolactonase
VNAELLDSHVHFWDPQARAYDWLDELPPLRRPFLAGPAHCADVTIVLDHAGKPDVAGGRLEPWRSDLRALAAHPNVVCKLSGLATEDDWAAWTPATVAPYLAHALEVFGPARRLFGSDWPVVTLAGSSEHWTDAVLAVLGSLDAGERQGVLAGNAERVYGLAR